MQVEMHEQMLGFFHERLTATLERRRMAIQESTEAYLVHLLGGYATLSSERSLEQPLVCRLAEAIHTADPAERLRQFRQLGDIALYTSGFFAEYLQRKGISTDYVARIGERAYQSAGDLAQRATRPLDPERHAAYVELAGRFEDFVGVLDEMRECTSLRTPQDIVRLYDRWRRTGSPLLAERLREHGVFPTKPQRNTLH